MIHKPEFMIVSGNGRNTGKTSFVEKVIKNICATHRITAIKVSPHFHPSDCSVDILAAQSNYKISRETDSKGKKDSSRMLRAGASKVYYIEAKDGYLKDALNILFKELVIDGPVVCESGGMRKFIVPSMLVLLNEKGRTEFKSSYRDLSPDADKFVTFDKGKFDLEPKRFNFNGSRWEVRG